MRLTLLHLVRNLVRKPDVPSVSISNLSLMSYRDEVLNYCKRFGNVKSVFIPMNLELGIHRGVAKVSFTEEDAVEKILAVPPESHIIDGNVVRILRIVGANKRLKK